MITEYETKVLEINIEETRNKLVELWAKFEREFLMKRWVFIMNIESNEWIRLRDFWDRYELSYKKSGSWKIGETQEILTHVEDFEKMAEILNKMNFKEKYYQEDKKIIYTLDNIEFCIDSWPKIPTFLEVESDSKENVDKWLKLLWLEWKDVGDFSYIKLYEKYGLDLHSFEVLKF